MLDSAKKNRKFLILRFSSIGDVLQSLSLIDVVRASDPNAEIDFVTQTQFVEFFSNHPKLRKCFAVKKGSGLGDLWALSKELRKQNYTHVYDAHNNLRSRMLCWFLRFRLSPHRLLRRSIRRFRRFLLFRFRVNTFEKPFSGQMDMIRPLKAWGIDVRIPSVPSLYVTSKSEDKVKELIPDSYVALAPSAAYPLKRWPLEFWCELIRMSPEKRFVLLGGPEDTFLQKVAEEFSDRVINMAGKLSLMESAAAVKGSMLLIANDTGVMHMAEQTSTPCIALMGPAPFGFPSKNSTTVLERNLWCRPCSKHGQGPCINKIHQLCLRDISPAEVRKVMVAQC